MSSATGPGLASGCGSACPIRASRLLPVTARGAVLARSGGGAVSMYGPLRGCGEVQIRLYRDDPHNALCLADERLLVLQRAYGIPAGRCPVLELQRCAEPADPICSPIISGRSSAPGGKHGQFDVRFGSPRPPMLAASARAFRKGGSWP